MPPQTSVDTETKNLSVPVLVTAYTATIFCVMVFVWTMFCAPPVEYPIGTVFVIKKGESVKEVVADLHDKNIVKSPWLLMQWIKLGDFLDGAVGGPQAGVREGTYFLPRAENFFSIASRIKQGDYQISTLKVTIPEGLASFEIGEILQQAFMSQAGNVSRFDKQHFADLAKKKEGYLFPDTYFFAPNATAEEIIAIMTDTFKRKTASLKNVTDDTVIMASILEGEARKTETRRIIAGILYNRLAIGMPLQVDAAFRYSDGKTTETLTLDDLQRDKPYNTYTRKGLPPTAISNPGLDALQAALNPATSTYFYFLTDKEGVMHYSTTFEGHVANKQKYLK